MKFGGAQRQSVAVSSNLEEREKTLRFLQCRETVAGHWNIEKNVGVLTLFQEHDDKTLRSSTLNFCSFLRIYI
ncbi:unnamed protein product [Heterobilharzia americana]|nr:unnamed protein product [Heterobilharzia americana]